MITGGEPAGIRLVGHDTYGRLRYVRLVRFADNPYGALGFVVVYPEGEPRTMLIIHRNELTVVSEPNCHGA